MGKDLEYNEKDIVTGKKFVTKIMNASRFVFMNMDDYKNKKPTKLHITDRLFLISLNDLVKLCTEYFDKYEFSKVKFETDNFFWKIFCDNYLEIIKNRIYNADGESKASAQYTLYRGLLTILKLMAPFTPFITEEIYQNYFKKYEKDKSIHVSLWPSEIEIKNKREDKGKFDLMIKIISEVRQEKTKAKKAMNAEISLTLKKEDIEKLSGEILEDLKSVTNSSEIKEGKFRVEFN